MKINIVSYTIDDRISVSGLFGLYESVGLPLEFIFDYLKDQNIQPSWLHLYSEMYNSGISKKAIIAKLSESIYEAYGSEYRDYVINKLLEYNTQIYLIKNRLVNYE